MEKVLLTQQTNDLAEGKKINNQRAVKPRNHKPDINLNIDGAPVASRARSHPCRSQTSRLFYTPLS